MSQIYFPKAPLSNLYMSYPLKDVPIFFPFKVKMSLHFFTGC